MGRLRQIGTQRVTTSCYYTTVVVLYRLVRDISLGDLTLNPSISPQGVENREKKTERGK